MTDRMTREEWEATMTLFVIFELRRPRQSDGRVYSETDDGPRTWVEVSRGWGTDAADAIRQHYTVRAYGRGETHPRPVVSFAIAEAEIVPMSASATVTRSVEVDVQIATPNTKVTS